MKKQDPGQKEIRFPVRKQVPHRDKMLLIDGMAWKEGETVKLSFPLPRDNVFVRPDGSLAPVALVEMLAQLCGAQHTFDHGLRADELHGYLVGIDNVIFSGPVRAGDELTFTAWKIFDMQEIKRVKGEVHGADGIKAGVELTLYESADWIPKPQNPRPDGKITETSPGAAFLGAKDEIGKGILGSMFNLVTRTGEEAEVRMIYSRDFIGFSGHFPGYPVLPAVLAIYSGWLLAEISQRQELELHAIRRAKFVAPILPGEEIEVSMKKIGTESADGDWFSVTLKSLGQLAAKFTIGTRPAAGRV